MRRRLLALVLLTTAALGFAPAVAANARAQVIDGMRVGHLPRGLGPSSDFRYEYDEVAFVSRVWESQTADGYREDLSIDVLRGARLTDAAELHDWFIAYEDRPTDEAHYVRTSVRGHPGWIAADEVFWLVRPGVAMAVRLDTARWSRHELRRVADSVR